MARRVLLVYDQSIVMQGLSVLLEAEPGVGVVGKARIDQDMPNRFSQLRPEIIIINLPFQEGLSINTSRQLLDSNP